VVIAAAAGSYFAFFRGKPAANATAATATVKQSPAPSAASATIATAPTQTLAPSPVVTPTATIDTSKVNEEVQKRLTAERARLDALQRAQTATQAPVLGRNTPPAQPQPQPAATQTVAPAPQPVVPAPQPVAPAPQPVAPAPQPEPQPQVQRAQLGELVPPGTEGLNAARISHQALATYPQIARLQRVQGQVIVNALINENGQVTETRVLSSSNGILNDAAVNSVKRSTFTPGTKDGVRVKSWCPVRVDFKL
jgi:TonB family protein